MACFLKLLSPFSSSLQNLPYQCPNVRKSALQESFGLALLLSILLFHRHMSSNCLLASSFLLVVSIIALSGRVSHNCLRSLKQKVVPTHSKNLRNCLCWAVGLGFFLTADTWLDNVLDYHYLISSGHSQ